MPKIFKKGNDGKLVSLAIPQKISDDFFVKPEVPKVKPICHIINAFKKAKIMMRLNILKFLEPQELVKFALIC